MLCTATPDISSSSENVNSTVRVSRLSFRAAWNQTTFIICVVFNIRVFQFQEGGLCIILFAEFSNLGFCLIFVTCF